MTTNMKIETQKAASCQSASSSSLELARLTPDEIFSKIDRLKQNFGPDPTFFEQIFLPGKREYGRALDEARSAAIKARKDLIDGLSSCIAVYVDHHKAELKFRSAGVILKTVETLIQALHPLNEQTMANCYEVYSTFINQIALIPNLSEAMIEEAKHNAYQRAKRRINQSESSFQTALETLYKEVESVIQELGKK